MRRTLRMIDYLTHNFIYNQRHCFLMDVIIKMMVNLLYDDISQFPASWFFLVCAEKNCFWQNHCPSRLLHPLHLFKFKHAQLMYKQTGAGIRLPTPEQAGGTCVSHWLWHATDRRRHVQTIGRVSRCLFDFSGLLRGQQAGRSEPVEDLISGTLWIFNCHKWKF